MLMRGVNNKWYAFYSGVGTESYGVVKDAGVWEINVHYMIHKYPVIEYLFSKKTGPSQGRLAQR